MHKEVKEELRVHFKLVVLDLAHHLGVTDVCRECNVLRTSFYSWKQKYEKAGRYGLWQERYVLYCHPPRPLPEIVEKILEIRTECQFGACQTLWNQRSKHNKGRTSSHRMRSVNSLSPIPWMHCEYCLPCTNGFNSHVILKSTTRLPYNHFQYITAMRAILR